MCMQLIYYIRFTYILSYHILYGIFKKKKTLYVYSRIHKKGYTNEQRI